MKNFLQQERGTTLKILLANAPNYKNVDFLVELNIALQAHDQRLLKRIEEEVEKKMRIKCICHGGGFKKTGNYYICCEECKESIQCYTNILLQDLLTLLRGE